MKRITGLFLIYLLLMSMTLTGCNYANDSLNSSNTDMTDSKGDTDDNTTPITQAPDKKVINVFSQTDELPNMVLKYRKLHPDFPYEIKVYTFATIDGDFHAILNHYLANGGEETPDIYSIESGKVMIYSKGEQSKYATPYKELGLDLDKLLKEADIPQYIIDMGSNQDGQLVSLAYQGTGGAFIYRRSIAKDVWGTDDPEIIKDKVGPGWEKFFEAAAKLKDKGYGIVSGDGDIWHSIENSAEKPWIVDGKLYIDPMREAFLDYAKELKDKGYSNNTIDWQDEWYADMKGTGEKQILGYFGASWMINYVLDSINNGTKPGEGTYGDWAVCEPPVGFFWGGSWVYVNKDSKHKEAIADIIKWITLDSSENGMQYRWANGTLFGDNGVLEAVASGTVMRSISATLEFLDNQNMFGVYERAARMAKGNNLTQYDEPISRYWREQVREYTEGNKTREQAVEDFKQMVKEKLNIAIE